MRFTLTLRFDVPRSISSTDEAKHYSSKSYYELEDALIDGKEAASVLKCPIIVFDGRYSCQTHEIDQFGHIKYL